MINRLNGNDPRLRRAHGGRAGQHRVRLFAPRVMRGIYADELERLDAYAREHRAT
jgi:hypothetical protein